MTALAAVGLQPGDEVIVPAYTWNATPLSVIAMNGIPIVCEVDDSLLMDPSDLEKKISPHTKVILPVHMRGAPCDMDRIMEIAKKHGLKVVEDTAQADGASYKGKRLGSIGDVGCFRFVLNRLGSPQTRLLRHPCSTQFNKIITAGEGGFVITNNTEYHNRALLFHDVAGGRRNKLDPQTYLPGINLRMSELQAAVLLAQLPKMDKIVSDMRSNFKMLREMIEPILSRQDGKIKLRRTNDEAGDAFICMVLIFPSAKAAKRAVVGLKAEGVEGVPTTPDLLFDPESTDYHVYYHWDTILEKRSWTEKKLPWCFAKREIQFDIFVFFFFLNVGRIS
jgi:dTDP-4-amino-4,6-dideoxygalactose transaminase